MKNLYYFATDSSNLKQLEEQKKERIEANLPKNVPGYWGTKLESNAYSVIPKWNALEHNVPKDEYGMTHIYQMGLAKDCATVNFSDITYKKNLIDILGSKDTEEVKKQKLLTYLDRINDKEINFVICQINSIQDLVWLYKTIGLAPNSIFLNWDKFCQIFDGIEITEKGFNDNLNEYNRQQTQYNIEETCYLDNQMAAFECPTLAVFNPQAVNIKHASVKLQKAKVKQLKRA